MGAAAELERWLIRARLQGGRRRKAAKGGYVGGNRLHPRYGYDLVDGTFVPREDQQLVITRIRGLRADGTTWQAIGDLLNAGGTPPSAGRQWYAMTARRIAQRGLS